MDHGSSDFEAQVYRKVSWRLMPHLFLCYILAYLDRVNIGFGKLQMQQDIGMSDAAYGLGAGIFFLGYFLFEIPSNIILQRIGARRWIGPIMMVWGVISAATLLVHSNASFLVLRFLLGIVESGFFPGVILYLTFWYPQRRRAHVVAMFMSAVAVAGVIGGPVSGWIIASMSDVAGLRGWQWLYLLEGLPSVLVGILTLCILEDLPSKAKWLTHEEKGLIARRLEEDASDKQAESAHGLVAIFRNGKVWLLALAYSGVTIMSYGLSFWLPQILRNATGGDTWRIGLLSAIPWFFGGVGMIVWGAHSDKTGERRWHFLTAVIVSAVAFSASALPDLALSVRLAALALTALGILAAQAVFWTMPTALLSGKTSAAGIAGINSVGNLGGFVGPYLVGAILSQTQNMSMALATISGLCLLLCSIAPLAVKKPVRLVSAGL